MSVLIGDLILGAREAVPDLPGVLPSPGSEISVTTPTAGSDTPLAAGTYYLTITYTNAWGETNQSQEYTAVCDGTKVISIVYSILAGSPANSAITLNAYLGQSSGQENQLATFTFPASSGHQFDITGTTTFSLQIPPEGNSAFIPDSGGGVASVNQIYRWANDAIRALAIYNGGIPDVTGLPSVSGQANFVLNGYWSTLDAGWYDGYPIALGDQRSVYRRNVITTLAGEITYTQIADRIVAELYPQPNRSAGTAQLSVILPLTGNVAQTGGYTGWVLPFGIALIGTEIVSYTMSGNNLVSLIRGLGGTSAKQWPIGTTVQELNVMLSGFRTPTDFVPGSAATSCGLPPEWGSLVSKYMLSRYRLIEQQDDAAQKLMQEFMQGMKDSSKKKSVIGERQIQPLDNIAIDAFPLLGSFGGGIIP